MDNTKDIVFYRDPILGTFTIQDLIYFLENQYIRSKRLDQELSNYLKEKGISNKKIKQLLSIADNTYNLKFIVDIMNDEL